MERRRLHRTAVAVETKIVRNRIANDPLLAPRAVEAYATWTANGVYSTRWHKAAMMQSKLLGSVVPGMLLEDDQPWLMDEDRLYSKTVARTRHGLPRRAPFVVSGLET